MNLCISLIAYLTTPKDTHSSLHYGGKSFFYFWTSVSNYFRLERGTILYFYMKVCLCKYIRTQRIPDSQSPTSSFSPFVLLYMYGMRRGAFNFFQTLLFPLEGSEYTMMTVMHSNGWMKERKVIYAKRGKKEKAFWDHRTNCVLYCKPAKNHWN